MTDVLAYERDAYRTVLDTEVVGGGEEESRPFVLLADTILYPEGGGQPADRGSLDGAPVSDVQRRGGEIRHYVQARIPCGPARVELDWPRRFDHMQQHTAQHLLTSLAQDRLGWPTTAFHLGPQVSDVELDAPHLVPEQLRRLEEEVAAEIRAARPVSARRVTPEEMAGLPVRTRGLPSSHTGEVRLVEIAEVDLNTCGGTHVRSTAEIEAVCLLGTEPMRGGPRVFFVAGGRVRARMAAQEERAAALRALLGAPDAEVVPAAEQHVTAERDLRRRLRAVEEELADALAADLAARPAAVAEAHFEGKDGGFLQHVARETVRRAPCKVVLLTSTTSGGALFCLAAGDALGCDLAALAHQVAADLGGRGGGTGRVFQGKASSLEGRGAALETLARATRS
jgi:alanyl-tRNA synthetase